jgi:hypothetical protein
MPELILPSARIGQEAAKEWRRDADAGLLEPVGGHRRGEDEDGHQDHSEDPPVPE